MARRSSTPRRSSKALPDLKTLLAERQTVTQWLARLSQADDGASDVVRNKVRADYETRLTAVSKQLEGFADELRAALSKETVKEAGLSKKGESADTRLGEAKLRHAVGEYDDDRWNKIRSEIQGESENAREELKVVEVEVARLKDVLSSIDKTPEDDRVSLAELEPDSLGDEGELEIIQPKDATAKKRSSGQTEAFDELEFLKKVAPEGTRRRSGASFKPAVADDLPELTPEPPELAVTAPEETPEIVPKDDDEVRKTLKCVECGVMNRPTEWYCESCGAELAAV